MKNKIGKIITIIILLLISAITGMIIAILQYLGIIL